MDPTASTKSAVAPTVTRAQFLNIFTAVFLPMFLAAVDQTLLATATPTIAKSLGGLTDTSWIAVAYLLSSASVVPVYGRLGDQHGRRDMLLVAVGIFSLGSLACGLAQSLPQLIGARVLQGLGGAGLMTMSQALIGELIAPRERVRFQAYFATVFTLASVSGPVLGGVVVTHASWRWLFFVNLPLAAFAVWRLLTLPRGERHPRSDGHDFMGTTLFAISAVGGLYWLTSGGHRFPWVSIESAVLLAIAGAGLIALVLRERNNPSPFLPVDLLRERAILYSLLTTLMFASCMFAMVFFLPIYLQLGHRVSPLLSGLLLLPLTGGMVCGSLVAARYVARTGRAKWVPVSGLSFSGFALLLLGAVAPTPGVVGFLGFLAGLGFGVIMPITQVVVQTVAGPSRLGAVTSMVSLFRSVGGAAGAAIFGAIVYLLLPDVDRIDAAHTGGGIAPLPVLHAFHIGFLAAAGVAFTGAFVASRIPLVTLWPPKVAQVAKETLAPVDGT